MTEEEDKEVFLVHNYGHGRGIPTYKGTYFLNKGFHKTITDKRLAEQLGRVRLVEVRSLGVLVSKTINELRKLASSRGVKKTFSMKKVELIKALGG